MKKTLANVGCAFAVILYLYFAYIDFAIPLAATFFRGMDVAQPSSPMWADAILGLYCIVYQGACWALLLPAKKKIWYNWVILILEILVVCSLIFCGLLLVITGGGVQRILPIPFEAVEDVLVGLTFFLSSVGRIASLLSWLIRAKKPKTEKKRNWVPIISFSVILLSGLCAVIMFVLIRI